MRITATLLVLLATIASAETINPDIRWVAGTGNEESAHATRWYLRQDSATSIHDDRSNAEVTPRLQFRCTATDAKITASIDWRRFISSFSTEAGFKVDGERFVWLKWKVDQTEQITSSPSVQDSQKLIALLKSGQELLVEITPYSESPVTTQFDLAGFADAIDTLATNCESARNPDAKTE